MSGPVVRVQHRSMGWKRWRAICTCKWRTAWTNEGEASQLGSDHAFDHGGTLEKTIVSGAL